MSRKGQPMTDVDRKSQHDDAPRHPLRLVHDSRPGLRHRASFGAVDDVLSRVADSDVTVLIRGESGTGKELAARTIHAASNRRDYPFVKVNCAAPAAVLETELFGCQRDTPGSVGQHRPGRIEFANHGTLFLDNIGELAAPLQLRLCRVLPHDGAPRVAGRAMPRLDVRVVASAAHDLERAVAEGRFRDELFFRLNVVCLTLAPLRQRRHELPELASFFVRHYAAHYNKPEASLSPSTLRVFSTYPWPGNVQELDAVVKRIVMLGDEQAVCQELQDPNRRPVVLAPALEVPRAESTGETHTLPRGITGESRPADAAGGLKAIARQAADGAERELIFRTLQHTRWNRREAAAILGVSYKALLYKIKRAEMDGAS
jgi:two-component system response regulator AtoC